MNHNHTPHEAGARVLANDFKGGAMREAANCWEAMCSECEWVRIERTVRSAELRVEMHTATTGHEARVYLCD